jgi:UDP-glucose 4-epimerase
MRVLVTGGAGFIGSHVVEQALQAGFEVAVLDNFSSGKRENVPAGVPIVECDLRDRAATLKAVCELKPALVSHQAAQASVPASMKNPHFDAEVNILGGLNLLDACLAKDAGVKHVVFASTGGAIYGEVPEGERAAESAERRPKSPYGISKLSFESLLGVYREHKGLSSTVLRYANVYGPRQDPHGEAGVVALFFDAALSGQKLTIFARHETGDGGGVRDYVYVGDAARANLLALQGKLAEPVLNVGTGEPTTTIELARHILRITGSSSPVEQGPLRVGDIERSLLDVSRFKAALGTPTSLADGLELTAKWYRAT